MSSRNRILYVDDDRDSLELVRFMLDSSNLDCTVVTVGSAKQAFELIESESFDLYIFDYRMPEISGIELCHLVRQTNPNKPVLFFSAMARSVDIAKGLNAGANEYLVKPGDLEKLTSTIKWLLEESLTASAIKPVIKTETELAPEKISVEKSAPVTWRIPYQKQARSFSKTQLRRFSKLSDKIKERKFDAGQIRAALAGQLNARALFVVTTISSIIVLHFFTQFILLGDERLASNTEIINRQNSETKLENTQTAEIRREREVKKSDIVKSPADNISQAIVQPEPKFVPSRTVLRKKVQRETKAERLRRAEKLLTGV